MSAPTVTARPSIVLFQRELGLGAPKHKRETYAKGDGSPGTRLVFTDLPVFRSGEFADSMGRRKMWESLHMQEMVSHFDFLKGAGLFAKAPIRKGHGSFFGDPMEGLVGWQDSLRAEQMTNGVDGKTYTYLLASGYIFDEEAMDRVEAGDWPNRSSEIGTFITNDEAEYWPTFMGFAYVDIPAVEGLNFSKFAKSAGVPEGTEALFDTNEKEFGVAGETAPTTGPKFKIRGVETSDYSAVQAYVDTLEKGPQHAFKIGGAEEKDFSKVQSYIDGVEAKATQDKFTARKVWAEALDKKGADGSAPKLFSGQVPGIVGIVTDPTCTDAPFTAFQKMYDDMPGNPMLAQHGNGSTAPTTGTPVDQAGQQAPGQQQTDATETRITTLREILAHHKLANPSLKDEDFAKMPSHIELQQLLASKKGA